MKDDDDGGTGLKKEVQKRIEKKRQSKMANRDSKVKSFKSVSSARGMELHNRAQQSLDAMHKAEPSECKELAYQDFRNDIKKQKTWLEKKGKELLKEGVIAIPMIGWTDVQEEVEELEKLKISDPSHAPDFDRQLEAKKEEATAMNRVGFLFDG